MRITLEFNRQTVASCGKAVLSSAGASCLAAFYCGSDELDTYLREKASQEARKKISTSFVVVEYEDNSVISDYSLSAISIATWLKADRNDRQ